MRTAHEIFLAVGVVLTDRERFPAAYSGYRAFTEANIAAIQAEAHQAGMKAGREAHNREWLMEKGMEP